MNIRLVQQYLTQCLSVSKDLIGFVPVIKKLAFIDIHGEMVLKSDYAKNCLQW